MKGLILKWCDRLDEARTVLAGEYQNALDRGDEASLPFLLFGFSELECWAGNWDTAEEYALEGCRVAEESRQVAMRPATLYSLALVRAHRGHVDQARELATETLALCERTGNVPVVSQALSVLGFAELSLGNYLAAASHLDRLADAVTAFGLGEPRVVRFLPDAIEALAALGRVDHARSLAQQLEERGKSLGRPWAMAAGARCRAHLAAVDGDLQGAQAACTQALAQSERLPMPFELGRTQLVKGMIERRARQKSVARSRSAKPSASSNNLARRCGRTKPGGSSPRSPRARLETGSPKPSAALPPQWCKATPTGRSPPRYSSPRTPCRPTSGTFQELGVKSRTELAAQFLSDPANSMTAAGAAIRSEPG